MLKELFKKPELYDNDDDDEYSLFTDFDCDNIDMLTEDKQDELPLTQLSNMFSDFSLSNSINSHTESGEFLKNSSCPNSILTCCSSTTTSERSSLLSYPSMKHVRFSHVEVREYAITVGDHPSCSSEPALTLDWKYATPTRIEIDTYSEAKNEKVKKSLRIPRWRRIALLREVAKMTNRDLLALGLSKNEFDPDEGSKRYAPPLKSKLIYKRSHMHERSHKYFADLENFSSNGIPRSKSMQNQLNLFRYSV